MSGQMENDEWILATLEKAMEKGRDVLCEGAVANYIPELAKANPSNLGMRPGILTSPLPCRVFQRPFR